MKTSSLWLGLFLAACIARGEPKLDEHLKLIPLQNGMNSVDLDGAGLPATIVVGRRDNFNAHSFVVTTIYATLKAAGEDSSEWKIIPIQREGGEELLHLQTSGGADCVLRDFRILADAAHHSALLITAERKFGASFADEQPVTFETYRLTRNEEGIPGAAALYFKFEKRWSSAKSYCDVNEAFQAELGLADGKKAVGR